MTRFVALLGGINVGGYRVTMDRLRTEVASLGYTDVANSKITLPKLVKPIGPNTTRNITSLKRLDLLLR